VKAKRPIWHLSRQPSNLCILPRHLGRVRLTASQKVKVEHAANNVILECGGVLALGANFHIHAIRVEEKDAVRSAMGSMLKVHGVVPVQVRAARNPKRVTRPQRARRVGRFEAEWLRVLAKAIDVGRGRECRLEAEVLRLEDEGMSDRRKEHLACARTRDVEREWRSGVRELNLRRGGAHVWVRQGSRENASGDLVALAGCIRYFEMDACF